MSEIKRENILEALKKIHHPAKEQDVVTLGLVQGLVVRGSEVGFALDIDPAEADLMEAVRKACDKAVMGISGVTKVTSVLTAERKTPPPAPKAKIGGHGTAPPSGGPQKIPGVKHVIAVASGKGGVGKSTTSVNLALAFQRLGLSAGVFDIDIYGPSIPRLMGIDGQPERLPDNKITPLEKHGIISMSIGYLLDEDTATIWRGPMVMGAIQQMTRDVKWDFYGELDVLVVDMPPGTGDAQLTLVQNVELAGAVIVSTPQDIALIDARKAFDMFEKTNTKTFGMIENMSYFLCPHCGERSDIFGHGGARDTAKEKGLDFLGEIPLHMDIRKTSDEGTPIVATQPDSDHTKSYLAIAQNILEQL